MRPRRWRRRILLAVLALALVLAAGMAVTAATTSYETTPLAYFGRLGDPAPPRWSRPCWRRNQSGVRYLLRCSRVRGVIVYREGHDPDGDGDVHGIAQAGAQLVVLKARPGLPRSASIPGVGHQVHLSGPVIDGRWGMTTVDVRGSAPVR